MSSPILAGLDPQVRAQAELALAWAAWFGVPVQVLSGFRTLREQDRLRRDWLSGFSKIPANAPGQSAHNFGLAFDSKPPPGLETWYAGLREWLGFCVPSNDLNHAEVCGWRRFTQQ